MSDELLARAFLARHPVQAAGMLEESDPADVAGLLAGAPVEDAEAVLRVMAPAPAAACLSALGAGPAAALLARMPVDAVAVLLRRMPGPAADALLDALPGRQAAVLRAGLGFPPRSAGALMDPRAPTLPPDVSVARAVARLRVEAAAVDDEVYVVDRDQGLVGVVPARVLLVSPDTAGVEDLMRAPAGRVPPQAPVEVVRAHPAWAHARTLPVVGDDGRFLGVVGYDVITRVADEAGVGRLAEASVSTFTSFSELCYVGSTHLLASLVSILSEQVARAGAGERA